MRGDKMKTCEEALMATYSDPTERVRFAFQLGWDALRSELMEIVKTQRECCEMDQEHEFLCDKIEEAGE